jgi:EpsI family protein
LLTLLGARWGASLEGAALEKTGRIPKDFLRPLALPYQGWKVTEDKLTTSELDMLQPDATLLRSYRSPQGDMAQIAVIAGHQKRSVHTPAYCMPGGGWEVLSQEPYELSLPGRKVPAVRALMRSDDGAGLVVTYFFTDGQYATRNLVRFQGEQLLKRLRNQVPLGALVRILVPIRKDSITAAALSDRFAKATVPTVMAQIRQARGTSG